MLRQLTTQNKQESKNQNDNEANEIMSTNMINKITEDTCRRQIFQ